MQFKVGDKVTHKVINYSHIKEPTKHVGTIVSIHPKSAKVRFDNGYVKSCTYSTLEAKP